MTNTDRTTGCHAAQSVDFFIFVTAFLTENARERFLKPLFEKRWIELLYFSANDRKTTEIVWWTWTRFSTHSSSSADCYGSQRTSSDSSRSRASLEVVLNYTSSSLVNQGASICLPHLNVKVPQRYLAVCQENPKSLFVTSWPLCNCCIRRAFSRWRDFFQSHFLSANPAITILMWIETHAVEDSCSAVTGGKESRTNKFGRVGSKTLTISQMEFH